MTYDELVSAAIAYSDRHDIEVAQNMDTFILMVEARVNRLLKTREQTARAFVNAVDDKEYYTLPPDYAGLRDIQVNSESPLDDHKSFPVSHISPEIMNKKRNEPSDGCHYCSIIANQIQIYPTLSEGQTIEVVYYQKVPNLNASERTNWMSESHPDIYMAGMTAEIELFAKHYNASTAWFDRMVTAVDELDSVDYVERWSGSQLVIRTDDAL